jgi:hypothetical protein
MVPPPRRHPPTAGRSGEIRPSASMSRKDLQPQIPHSAGAAAPRGSRFSGVPPHPAPPSPAPPGPAPHHATASQRPPWPSHRPCYRVGGQNQECSFLHAPSLLAAVGRAAAPLQPSEQRLSAPLPSEQTSFY